MQAAYTFQEKDTEISKFLGVVPHGFQKCGVLTLAAPVGDDPAEHAGVRSHEYVPCAL